MNPCKAKLPDGKPCPNQADTGQDYCPYHLSGEVASLRKKVLLGGGILGLAGWGLKKLIARHGKELIELTKSIVDKIRPV